MGEDFCVCCVCDEATSDYQRYKSCDGCGNAYCCKECTEEAIKYKDDGQTFLYCLDCFNVDDLKNVKINRLKTLTIYEEAIFQLELKIRDIESKIKDHLKIVKVLKQ